MIARLSMRQFAARFFAVVALATAALLTPLLRPSSCLLAIALPFIAATCAYIWTWLLYPRKEPKEYGPLRGAIVTLLSYLSLAIILAIWGFREDAGLLILGLFVMPFAMIAFAAGAGAGGINLRYARSKFDKWISMATRVRMADQDHTGNSRSNDEQRLDE